MLITHNEKNPTYLSLLAAAFICILLSYSIAISTPGLSIIIFFVICGFLFVLLRPDIAMLFLIFSMLLSPEFVIGNVTTQRPIMIRIDDLIITSFLLGWFLKLATQPRTRIIPACPLNKFIILYSAIFIFSTLKGVLTGNLQWHHGVFYILKYLEYFFIFYFALIHTKSLKQIKIYIFAIIITFVIVNVMATLQINQGIRVSAPFEGVRGEPNTLGGYQVLIIALLIGLLINKNFKFWRHWISGIIFFSLIPFIYTLSRSSYMAIIPMYFTIIFLHKSRFRNLLIGFLIILTIISIFYFPTIVKDRIKDAFTPNLSTPSEMIAGVEFGPSASERIRSWQVALEEWKTKPFWGHGITSTGFIDGQFFRTLVELGAVGLTALLLLLFKIFQFSLRYYRQTQDPLLKGIALGFMAGHVGLICHALSANTFIIIRIMEPYWLIAAFVMLIPQLDPSFKKSSKNDITPTTLINNQPPIVSKNPYLHILLNKRGH